MVSRTFDRRGRPAHEDVAGRGAGNGCLRQSRDSTTGDDRIGTLDRTANRPGDAVFGDLTRIVTASFAGRCHGREVNGLPYPIAPDIFYEFRVINERIAVMLDAINGLVTVNLLLRDGVLTMPCEEEREAVGREVGRTGSEHLSAVAGVERVGTVARNHIEERACEVSFVLIVGFIASTDIGGCRCTEFAETVVLRVLGEAVKRTAYHAVWVVRAEVVDTCVGGIDVKEIGDHRSGTQPGLAYEVLLVPTIADSRLRHVGMRHVEGTGRVHIPERVGIEVRLLVIGLSMMAQSALRMASAFFLPLTS